MIAKLDILAIGIHPDDVEISASGTLIRHVRMGRSCGVVHLSKGELGTRGTAAIRMKEAALAAKIMGLAVMDTCSMRDGFFSNDETHQGMIIEKIRMYRPDIVLCNAFNDRHPDHGRAAQLTADACFYSGLLKIKTSLNGKAQQAWRPKAVYHYIQDRGIRPDFVVDISKEINLKMKAIKAYSSQFYKKDSKEPATYISSPAFLKSIRDRSAEFGRIIGVEYAEGFTSQRYPGVNDLFHLV